MNHNPELPFEKQEQIEKAIALLYDAAFKEETLPLASAMIDEVCGSSGSGLVVADQDASGEMLLGMMLVFRRGERSPEWEKRYAQDLYKIDERLPRIRRLPHRALVPSASLFSEQERKHSFVFNEMLPLAGAQNGLEARLRLPEGAHITWHLSDPTGRTGEWSSLQIRRIKYLMPHIELFVRVRRALVSANAVGHSHRFLLDNQRIGVIQLDYLGRITAANDMAVRELRSGQALKDNRGQLHARSPDMDRLLQSLISAAIPQLDTHGAGGSLRIPRHLPDPPLIIHVVPVADPDSAMRPRSVATLLLFADCGQHMKLDPAMVAQALGLTLAESKVVALLCQGSTPQSIAQAIGCGIGTVRWHLHRIYAKLGVKGQAELVALAVPSSRLLGNPGWSSQVRLSEAGR